MMPSFVMQVAPTVCSCEDCVLAGCDKPPLLVRKWQGVKRVWLHGRDLKRFYATRDREAEDRQALADRLRQDHLKHVAGVVERQTGLRAQRGDEPR